MDRRTMIAVLLLAPLLGAAVAMIASGGAPDVAMDGSPAGSPAPSRSPSPPPQTQPSSTPTADTAGSTIVVEDFDMIATGGDVPGWASTGSATLDVAAVPTAVDRSARLTAEENGRACRPLMGEVAGLTADFMVEPLPSDSIMVLTLELGEDSAVTFSVSAEGGQLTDSSELIRLQPRTWYRWSASRDDESFQLALSDLDGAELGGADAEAQDTAATRFCISTESPTRMYLDSLTVEGH